MQNRALENMQNGSCDAGIAAVSSFAAVSARTQQALNSDVRDLHVMKQVHKKRMCDKCSFQSVLPARRGREGSRVCDCGRTQKGKKKKKIQSMLN